LQDRFVVEHDEYMNCLALLPAQLASRPAELAEWAKDFCTAGEIAAHEAIEKALHGISALQAQISSEEALITRSSSIKQLIAGTGDPFKNAVAAAFQELGLKVVDGPHPRADLIGFNSRVLAAIEAKGVQGAAKESNLRQTDRWVAEVRATLAATAEERLADPDLRRYAEQIEKLGVPFDQETPPNCKGIMVIGTFRNIPLDERSGIDFPEPMSRLIPTSGVCSLTGLQLFCLIMRGRDKPDSKGEILDRIFETNGKLDLPVDWHAYLQKIAPYPQKISD
jgi:hypothetical protein